MDTNSLQELNKAISEVGEELKKGEQMEELLKTIQVLGKEGLRKALPKLSNAQKELLHEVLSKAKDMTVPAQMSANKKPQKTREPLTEEKSNSEEGVDEADEKLMDDANKTQNHQGGSDDKPEGWEGQVIKSKAREEAKEKIMSMEEHEHGIKNPKKLVEAEKKEHSKEKKEEAMEKHIPGVSDKKFDDCVTDVKVRGGEKNSYAICTASLKKSEELTEEQKLEKSEIMHKMVERMRKRGMERAKCIEALKKKGYDHEMADKVWGDQDEADKVKEAPAEEAVKKEPKKDASKKIEKSILWGDPQAAIRSGSLGRAAHYDTVDFIEKSEARKEELRKSGETFHDGISEVLSKANSGKPDWNEMIAKGLDRSSDRMGEVVAKDGPAIRSFSEEDFLKSWAPEMQSKLKKLSNKPEKSDEEKAKEDEKKKESEEKGE